ncbi:MAG: efflux RND transporter periplasmic adaptor subunit [Pirellula sp.]
MKIDVSRTWPYLILLGAGIYAGGWCHSQYVGRVWPFHTLAGPVSQSEPTQATTHVDEHAGHDHGGHADGNSLELSESAKKNLGLTDEYLQAIELKDYQQTITVPSIVVDRPGRTRTTVSAAMTGIVTHVHVATGEAVEAGDLILEMRLAHEDLVTAQKDYLQSLGDRDVELKEIARLESVANSGAISPKTLLERQYNRDKLESLLRSQKESLRLHGLTEAQIAIIDSQRRLLTEIRVYAPSPDGHPEDEIRLTRQPPVRLESESKPKAKKPAIEQRSSPFQVANFQDKVGTSKTDPGAVPQSSLGTIEPKSNHLLVLHDLQVRKGQTVNAGETLCVLGDYDELLIEGQAFETEIAQVTAAKLADRPVTATVSSSGKIERIENLPLSWISNEVDPATRTLKFYVTLKNEITEDKLSQSGQRYVSWKYRVGQRMEIGVPIAQWKEQIVLPVDAVVREGIDSFVFQQNGDHFDRVAVHEKHRDQSFVVIENDGSLYPGDVVALRGAHQMEMALKSKSGGGIDPHAGHSH